MKPTVGRIVHYYDSKSRNAPLAAIITAVHDDRCVNLTVFGNQFTHFGLMHLTSVVQSEAPTDGAWTWPPLVKPA